MTNYTTSVYEVKREIINFSEKISNGLSKPCAKFVSDMIYGISKSKSILLSNISRALLEKAKLKNTIERLSDNCNNLKDEELEIIKENYFKEAVKLLSDEEIILIEDDSDINKEYSKKLEDLCTVRDASKIKETYVNGYHVCEMVALTENEKQPISLYSNIYSTESKGFNSTNDETKKSEDYVIERLRKYKPNAKLIIVKDRGFDTYDLFDKNINDEVSFIVRLDGDRNLLFKGKPRIVKDVAKNRKGTIHTKLMYKGENVDCYISYTKVQFPKRKDKDLTLVTIYRCNEENDPMYLLTDLEVKGEEDAIRIARIYMLRWRVEEYFRAKKQNYSFEKFRLRTLRAINNLNTLLSAVMLHKGKIADNMDKKLLVIKIIEASQSLKNEAIVWYGQIASGISNILAYARTGIKEYQKVEVRPKFKQLQLQLEC